MKSIIVAFDENNGIGANNDMMWHGTMAGDAKHVRTLTTGTTLIMGRNTFDSIGHALPNRENIVVSRTNGEAPGVIFVTTLEEAYELATHDIFVFGGGQIYAAAIDDVDKLYVTEIHATFPNATVFFPKIDTTVWHETVREHHKADDRNEYAYDFVEYERISL